MAENVLKSYLISLGFKEVGGSEFKRSLKDYEAAVVKAEKAIEDARWEGAKSQEEIAKLTRETNLKLAREALAKAQETKKAEEEAAKRRKAAVEAAAAALSKLALAAAAAATAVGFAMAKLAANFNVLHYQSERTGASVSSIKSLGYAFEQTGSSAARATAALDKFTTGQRNNPGLRQFVKELGVDDKLAPAERLLATVAAIQAKSGGDRAVGHQYAELLGISEEDYDHLVRQGAAVEEYARKFEAASRRMGVNQDDVADKAVKFSRAVGRLSMQVEVLASALAAKLLPPLTKVIESFSAWLDSNPGALDKILKAISDTLVSVAEGISNFLKAMSGQGGDEFIARWRTIVSVAKAFKVIIEGIVFLVGKLVDGLGLVVSGTRQVLQFLRLTPAGSDPAAMLNALSGGTAAPNGPGGSNTGNAVPPDDRTTWEKYAPKALGGKDAPQAGDGSRAWRNNNPGNIKMGDFARSLGATEADDKGFAKFPSYEAGRKAQEKLLFEGKNYRDKTIAEAIKTWAPASDGNDPAGYAQLLAKAAGVDVNTKLADLNSEQRGRLLDAQQRKEGWTPGRAPSEQRAGNTAPVDGVGGLDQRQSGTRSQPISAELQRQIVAAAKASGVNAEVYSGGQDESGPNRTGSHRHDHGRSADLKLYTLGADGRRRYLSMNNADERAVMEKFIRESVANGANGVGSGPGYMGESGIHVGGGSPSAWGAGGSSANAPDWVRRAFVAGMEARDRRPAPAPTVPRAGASMSPGGFDVNAATRPATPAGIGGGSISNSTANDNRAFHQTITNNTTVTGVEKPNDHARVVEKTLLNVNQMSLENAQSAIA